MCEEYNGWKNYQTWNIALWLENEEPLYIQARELVASHPDGDQYHKEQDMRAFVEELIGPALYEASFVADLLNHSLSKVDWPRIVEAFEEDDD